MATTPFENDVFGALRFALNDVQSTEILAGVSVDTETASQLLNIEASRRFGESWKVNFEYRDFFNTEIQEFVYTLRKDGYLQLEIQRYF